MTTETVTEQAQAPTTTGELPAIEPTDRPPRRRFRLTLKLLIVAAVAYYFVVPLAPDFRHAFEPALALSECGGDQRPVRDALRARYPDGDVGQSGQGKDRSGVAHPSR